MTCDLPETTEGREELEDGSTYEGQFLASERHGWGKITWPSGGQYEGQFCHNNMHGDGTLKWDTGVAYTGQWCENELGPRGLMTWPDGRRYRGEFLEGEKHGEGRLAWPDGRAYRGQWVAGKQHGYGFIAPGNGPAHLSQWDEGQLLCWLEEQDLSGLPVQERAYAVVSSGAVRLLSAMWLLEQPEDFTIQRPRELPHEAFLSAEEAASMLDKRYSVVVMSYGWLTTSHPDPDGFHVRTLRSYLRKHAEYFTSFDDIGVFWDFVSLPTTCDPNTEEYGMRSVGLTSLSFLYGSKKTMVIKLTQMPKASQVKNHKDYKLSAYDARGWCFYEATIAAILKDADQVLDLGIAGDVLTDEDAGWESLRDGAFGTRHPPLLPEDMKTALEKRLFTDGDDRALVCAQYARFFSEAAAVTLLLCLANESPQDSGWSDADVKQLCRALPAFKACKALSLANHMALGGAGLVSLRGKLPEMRALQRLVLPQHLQLTREGQALTMAWSHAGKKPDNLVWLAKFGEIRLEEGILAPDITW
eukprot:CAMPEP_0171078942 /NCGR_PEP_ID=MMETSP0766_2-20121228/14946_1 /TAXON_ID=439317 /ORGANISM="Gambierdiscus australes, Strain CAWD 149" /LENGTH=528 /DNA_ID=CAMNT_0011536101 /DNA_START=33 /DNA_END=1619 /DNA_ORIENTATION=+